MTLTVLLVLPPRSDVLRHIKGDVAQEQITFAQLPTAAFPAFKDLAVDLTFVVLWFTSP